MSESKGVRPRLTVAPEFAGLGRLTAILKPGSSTGTPIKTNPTTDSGIWTVFGIGAIWQAAAENAARLSGTDLSSWLTHAIDEAAASQGIVVTSSETSR